MTDSASNQSRRRWLEPASAILMALATLSTAWCSYQSSKWTGRSNDLATTAAHLDQKGGLLRLEDNQVASIQVKLFGDFISARISGNEKLAQFYSDRFPPELRRAFDRWMEQQPFENPKADAHPFVPSLYKTRFADEIRQVNADAASKGEEAKRTGTIAARYLSNTVLFAMVLFFAGTSAKFDQRHVRLASFFFAGGVFLFAVSRMFMLPVFTLFS
jgi:ferric-dicitrate binding protein FerR (iron transport regulator)